MITIKNIKAVVETRDSKKYGFDFNFNKGLNILSGYNASGKSTVLSCIYYCLGMEQLYGGYNADNLHDCLKQEFKYSGNDNIKVFNSYAEITIENENAQTAKIKRIIKSVYDEKLSLLAVTFNNKTEDKYIHSTGDSDAETGFYKWLVEFIGIQLPTYEGDKILYLQHIFTCGLVEQTKGWSDFFAQIPNFNTKKPKQKIVEYSLGLNGLIDDHKKDILKSRQIELKQQWSNIVFNFKSLATSFNVELPSLSDDFIATISPTKINKLELWIKDITGELILLDKKVEDVQETYNEVLASNNISTENLDQLKIEQSELVKRQLKQLADQLDKITLQYNNEQEKRINYSNIIESRKNEVETLDSKSKIDKLKDISLDNVDKCPVCDSSLLKDSGIVLKNQEKVSTLNSIEFFKSEIKLYESYLSNSAKLIARFEKVKLYYTEQIRNKKTELQAILSDLYDDSRLPSREIIAKEIQLHAELNKYNLLQEHFSIFKKDLLPICRAIGEVKDDLKGIKKGSEEDSIVLKDFTDHFKLMLKKFGYSEELRKKVIFDNEEPQKLLPAIRGAEKPQPIRLKSSASDFIRALWSFYLSLLTKARHHVGFLVLDEPGQHAIDKISMVELLKYTSSLKDRQVILAISKNHQLGKNKEIPLKEIIGDLKEGEDFKFNEIKDNDRGDKCIQEL